MSLPLSNQMSKAHNVLFAVQGAIFAAAALHNDLASILTNILSYAPMIGGTLHLIYHEIAVAKAAFAQGKNASIVQTANVLQNLINSSNTDKTLIDNMVRQLISQIKS